MRDRAAPEVREFEVAVSEFRVPLGRFLAQLVQDRALAEDLLQETFCVAWRRRLQLPTDPGHRRAWFYTVARNQALAELRKQRRGRRAMATLDAGSPLPLTEDVATAFAMRDLLDRTLTADDRSLFILGYVHHFSSAELAEITGTRPAAVRKRLERAAAKLRAALAAPSTNDAQECHAYPSKV